ncbi:uncharacterized protein [Linepithema humile]|uniref:uncharacterized protein n=1 Tax=Linepithema humile TaxID=83485 RepID=UPI00351F1AEC
MDVNEIWCNDCNTKVYSGEEHECYIDNNNKDDYIERLIAEVFVRESLWNSTLPYKLRGPANMKTLWSEVDACLETPTGSSQIKWKSLRDRFVKEHYLQSAYIPSGSGAVKRKSSWPLYDTLRFLIPTVNYRRTKSNLENIHPDIQLSLPNKSALLFLFYILLFLYFLIHIFFAVFSSTTSDSASNSDLGLTIPKVNEEFTHVASKRSHPLPLPLKCKKKSKTTENMDTRLEEVILKELQQTNEHVKLDKIESFVKYIEACLRSMTADISKRVMKKIATLLFEEDI